MAFATEYMLIIQMDLGRRTTALDVCILLWLKGRCDEDYYRFIDVQKFCSLVP